MKFKPHQYQNNIVDHILSHESSGIFADMGLGKTASVLLALTKMRYKRVLIVAPLRVAHSTWPGEIEKWTDFQHLQYITIKGSPAQRLRLVNRQTDIHLINYEQLPWLIETWGVRWPYDVVILDEFSKMKSPSTKRFKAMKKIRKKIKRVVGLTGTPAPNGLMDLWSQSYLLDQGDRLGRTFYGFRQRWFTPDFMGYNWEPKAHAEKEIHERLSDICLSMSASDYLKMPDRIDNTIKVGLPPAARKTYENLEKDFIAEISDETIVAPNAAAAANKCLQCSNGAIYTEEGEALNIHSLKLDALEGAVEEAAGAPVLIAYNFKSDAVRIQQKFGHSACERLDQDPKTIERWNNGEIPILLAHPASAGHGLNLQAGGNIVIWFGLSWSLENYQQFNARLHRQGQGKPVFVHHIVAEKTIDQKVLRVLGEKEITQNGLLKAMKKEYTR